MQISLTYRPCSCAKYDGNGAEVGADHPEFFESEIYAALRFREHVRDGRKPLVHMTMGSSVLHVSGVMIDKESYQEDG